MSFPPAATSSRAWAILGAALVAAALTLALAPLPAPWIERAYANGLHPILQRALTGVTNFVPFALGDLVFAAAILILPITWAAGARAARRSGLPRAAGLALARTIVILASAYLVFLFFWGLNYRRVPLTVKLDYDVARVTDVSARTLAARTIALLDEDAQAAHREPWPDDAELVRRLALTFDAAAQSAGDRRGIVPAYPKTSLGDAFLGASGTAGFTHPVTHEVVLDRTVLDCEKPFLLAHEWGHLAGFADESEASFVGLLACARSASPAIRYAGWLALYAQLPEDSLGGGPPGSPGADAPLTPSPLVMADLRAIAQRAARRRSPWISRLSSRTYDRFLKANRVSEGIASYGLAVRLVLGVRFEESWVPAPRPTGRSSEGSR